MFKTIKMKRFKRHKDYDFFDQDIRLTKLSNLCDPLKRLFTLLGIPFEKLLYAAVRWCFHHAQAK